jgi:two-component system, cell cycle response regulator
MIAEPLKQESAVQTFRTPKDETATHATQPSCLVHIYPTGPSMGTRYPLGKEPAFIGRQDDCAVRNTDPSVSRYHARIDHGDRGEYIVVDLNSTNGTFVNNQRKREGELRDGDYLRIGNCIYRFLGGGNLEAAYHEEIYRLTVLDALTQIHNRRYLTEFLDREIIRSHRYGRPLAVVMLDLDHFKSINDRFGHLAGDLTLKDLAARLKPLTRADELLARYGGEEFALVLPESDVTAARTVAEQVRKTVEKSPFSFNGVTAAVTVSLGVAVTTPGEQLSSSEILARADANLYRAKAAGRNRVAG